MKNNQKQFLIEKKIHICKNQINKIMKKHYNKFL